jgi:putative hydrolase of the HAD superfamily
LAIKAVLFDLDDTLFDHAHCARAALSTVQSSHPCFSTVAFDALQRSHSTILDQLHGDVAVGRVPLDAARIERFRRLYRFAGHEADDALAAATATAYRQAYLDARRPVDGASQLLDVLRPHARIGVVTNNLLAEQREKLRHCGLDRFVDELIASEEAGVSKPDPRIFQLALERLQCAANEAVMVGDSWANDIEGARAAGIRAVWFNPAGGDTPDPTVPTLHTLDPRIALPLILSDSEERTARSG